MFLAEITERESWSPPVFGVISKNHRPQAPTNDRTPFIYLHYYKMIHNFSFVVFSDT